MISPDEKPLIIDVSPDRTQAFIDRVKMSEDRFMKEENVVLVVAGTGGKSTEIVGLIEALTNKSIDEPMVTLDSLGWWEDQSHRRRFPKEQPGRYIGRHAHSNSKTKMEQRRKNSKAARKARKKSR